ncbi:MAG: hypothetical protein RJA70_4208, partial [Pseudomonadota bacterium]
NANYQFVGEAARWNSVSPPEMVVPDEDSWLWQYIEEQLGPTTQKEYLRPATRRPGPYSPP